jgi:hypothetical protein
MTQISFASDMIAPISFTLDWAGGPDLRLNRDQLTETGRNVRPRQLNILIINSIITNSLMSKFCPFGMPMTAGVPVVDSITWSTV